MGTLAALTWSNSTSPQSPDTAQPKGQSAVFGDGRAGLTFNEAQGPPRGAGNELGKEATVKISAYDSNVFGSLKGKVERISADTIADEKPGPNGEKEPDLLSSSVRYRTESIIPIGTSRFGASRCFAAPRSGGREPVGTSRQFPPDRFGSGIATNY
jgi:hypothetical protein